MIAFQDRPATYGIHDYRFAPRTVKGFKVPPSQHLHVIPQLAVKMEGSHKVRPSGIVTS